jgi:PAS domain S-box-containing protein
MNPLYLSPAEDSAKLFQLLAESIPQLVWTARPDGRVDYLNRRWQDYSGNMDEALQGWSWKNIIHPSDLRGFLDLWTNALGQPAACVHESRLRRQDGVYRWFSVRVEPLVDREGGVICWFGTCTDIHEQKTKQETREERYRRLVEAAQDGIWELTLDGTTTFVNERMAVMLGMSAAEMRGRSVYDFTFPESLDRAREQFTLRDQGDGRTFVWRFRRRDGAEVNVLASCSPITNSAGEITSVVGIFSDLTQWQASERQLRHSEDRFRASVENLLDCFGVYSAVRDEHGCITDFRVEYVNQAACQNNALTAEEQIGRGLLEIMPEHRPLGLFDEYCQVVKTGVALAKEMQFYEGQYAGVTCARWFDVRVSKFGDGIVATWRDVTDLKQAMRNLEAAEKRFCEVADNLPLIVWLNDAEGKQEFVNQTFCQYFGVTLEEMRQGRWQILTHPDDGPYYAEQFQQAVRDRTEFHAEVRVRRHDGEWRWIESWARPRYSEAGQFLGHVGTIADITDRKRAEASLRENRDLLCSIIDNAETAIYAKDFEGRFILSNRKHAEVLGTTVSEVIGKTDLDFVADSENVTTYRENDLAVARTGTAIQFEEEFVADNSTRTFLSTKFPLRNATGEVYATCGISADVTGRKSAEQQLAEQRRLYKTITDNATLALFVMDERQQCVFMNPAAEKLTGFTLREIQGQPLHDVIHHTRPDGSPYPRCECPIDQAFPQNNCEQGEEVFVHKDGHFYHVAFTASPVRDEHGLPTGTVIEVRDITQEKQTRAALEESEHFYRQMLESVPGMTFTTRPDGYCDYQSLQWEEFTGVPMAEHMGWGWNKLLHPDDRDRAAAAWRATVEGQSNYDLEYRVRRHDGQSEWFKVCARPIRDAAGTVVRWFGTAVNVDKLKHVEQVLLENEAHLRHVLDNLLTFVGVLTPDGTLNHANRAPLEAAGIELPDVVGQKFWDTYWWSYSPELQDQVREAVKRAGQGEVVRFDAPVRMAENKRIWIDFQIAPLRDAEGRITHLIPSAMDLTSRRQAEEELRESEARFRLLADNISQFAWITDAAGQIFWFNKRWYEYIGTSFDEVQGDGWRQFNHPDHVERVTKKYQQHIAQGAPWEDVFPLRSKNGEYRWFLSRALPIHDQAGNIKRWFGTNTDITAQRQAEDALREADQRKDEFLATLAHELRNPLAPIANAVQILNLTGPADQVLRDATDVIERQVEHLTRLVNDLLDVSRISRGKLHVHLERLPLATVLQVAIEASRPHLDSAGHQLHVELADPQLQVDADQVRLAQVFTNILNNAAKFTDPGGDIYVRSFVEQAEVVVSIKDTGRGIDPDHLPRLFEMFSQFHPALERSQGGLGIGLSLVRGLVAMHGGSVEAKSEGLGRGTELIVRLPRPTSDAPVEGSVAAGQEVPITPSVRVLVVDDNHDSADTLAMLLRLSGNEVITAYHGVEALRLIEQEKPRFVLLDIGLPGLNGYEICERVRRQPWGPKIVMIAQTGWGQEADRHRADQAGFDYHLVKPIDAAQLRTLLQEHSP